MPTLLNLFGLRFFFYSDEHLPMHVHIQNSDGKAKIIIGPTVEVEENNGIKPHDIRRALEITRMYQEEFIKAWEEYHGE
jgi:ABC-type ATPase with predicted acetyltransferase domain